MRAGLLADLILGESPYLKGLVRHFNVLVLNVQGKITGFNAPFLQHIGQPEARLLHQSFAKFFDCEEGKAALQVSVQQALKGKPSAIQFYLSGNPVRFSGVILPVYDSGIQPASLLVMTREEYSGHLDHDGLEDFWVTTQSMMSEIGIGSPESPSLTRMPSPSLLLVADQQGFLTKVFQSPLKANSNTIRMAPDAREALEMFSAHQAQVIVSAYDPVGELTAEELARSFRQQFDVPTLFLSQEGNELRLEDGWLDIHIRYQTDSVKKILDLIQQFY